MKRTIAMFLMLAATAAGAQVAGVPQPTEVDAGKEPAELMLTPVDMFADPYGWTIEFDTDGDGLGDGMYASGDWTWLGFADLASVMSDGKAGGGSTYAQRMRECLKSGQAVCAPQPLCWAWYTEKHRGNGTVVSTDCMIVCKEPNRPCPPPPVGGGAGGGGVSD